MYTVHSVQCMCVVYVCMHICVQEHVLPRYFNRIQLNITLKFLVKKKNECKYVCVLLVEMQCTSGMSIHNHRHSSSNPYDLWAHSILDTKSLTTGKVKHCLQMIVHLLRVELIMNFSVFLHLVVVVILQPLSRWLVSSQKGSTSSLCTSGQLLSVLTCKLL